MKSTTAKFKQIMASGSARKYLMNIYLTLADNTQLTLTEEDIWSDSFKISTASSGTSSFDIGTAVIGKCSFTINNISGDFDDYDFFNATATVWLGLDGDVNGDPETQTYYRMGFYTVDEPQRANGLISLELLDNMWKFDVPFSGVTVNYPVTARNAVLAICSYCGVNLNTQSFHGYNFSIASAPEDVENMNCREMLQYIAMLGCNFCCINDNGTLDIKWYDVNATAAETDVFELNKSTSFGTDEIEITGVKFVIDDTAHTIGTSGYVLELENPLVTASNVNSVLNLIWDVLEDFTLTTFNVTTASDLAAEIGDKVKIKDYQGNYVYSWLTNNNFKFAGHQLQCAAETPNRTLVKRYSKTVQAAVAESRRIANEIISYYDLDVQELNKLVEQSMGAYTEWELAQGGGRIYYISNMPITKDAQGHCSFASGSIVWRMAGDVFSVSTDGGVTWVNGYNPQTGKLIVNVLSTIGLQFDWARGGTLTLGGYGNGNGELSILNSANTEKVHGDNSGISIGGTTGSKMKLTTNGELEYYYDNAYSGRLRMYARNYGTTQDPDIRDTFEADDFTDIYLNANSNATIHLSDEGNQGSIDVRASGDIVLGANEEAFIGASDDVRISAVDELHLTGGNGIFLNGVITPDPNYAGTSITTTIYGIDSFGNKHDITVINGIVTSDTNTNVKMLDYWHTWTSGGVTYSAIVLSAGVSQASFPDINANYAYEPFIQVASGQPTPMIESVTITGTTYTVTFETITSAQAAGGACVIKLRTVV